jgi:hypothetical protein
MSLGRPRPPFSGPLLFDFFFLVGRCYEIYVNENNIMVFVFFKEKVGHTRGARRGDTYADREKEEEVG